MQGSCHHIVCRIGCTRGGGLRCGRAIAAALLAFRLIWQALAGVPLLCMGQGCVRHAWLLMLHLVHRLCGIHLSCKRRVMRSRRGPPPHSSLPPLHLRVVLQQQVVEPLLQRAGQRLQLGRLLLQRRLVGQQALRLGGLRQEGWGGVGWGGMGSRQKLTRGWQTPEQAAQSSCSLAHSRGSQPSHCPQALQRARSSGSTTAHVVAAADLGAAGVRVAGGHVQRVVLCRRSGGGLKTEATWRGVAGTQGPNRWQAVPVIAALHGMQQGRAGGQGRAPDSGV